VTSRKLQPNFRRHEKRTTVGKLKPLFLCLRLQ